MNYKNNFRLKFQSNEGEMNMTNFKQYTQCNNIANRFLAFLLCLSIFLTMILYFPQSIKTYAANEEYTATFDLTSAAESALDKTQFNGHTYQLFDLDLTWTEAKEYCESLGGHLITISSSAEQTFLISMIRNNESYDEYAIGLYFDIENDEWKWVDGSPLSYTYWNWYKKYDETYHMPDNWWGDEYYGHILTSTIQYEDWKAHKGMWDDAQDFACPFVCEWDSAAPIYNSSASDIKLKYTGNLTNRKETVTFNAKSLEIYADAAPSTVYQPHLAYMLSVLASSAYTVGDIDYNLQSLGFQDYNLYNYYYNPIDPEYEEDSCAFSIAQKKTINNNNLVLITIRGTYGGITWSNLWNRNSDWSSNFNIWTQELFGYGKHKGFETAMKEIYFQLKEDLGDDLFSNNTRYIITGHSRGAGIANLLAKRLCDEGVSKFNVFDYNFACPDVAKATSLEWNFYDKYNNIFNIGVAGDLVTLIPGVLGDIGSAIPAVFTQWGKYGQTRWFSDDWDNISFSSDVVFDNHASEKYVKFMSEQKSFSQGKTWKQLQLTKLSNNLMTLVVMCPVDAEISDDKGNVLASVIETNVEYNTSDDIDVFVWTEEEHKYFIVFGDSAHSINLKGTDDGSMDCMVSVVSDGEHKSKSIVCYEDVQLYNGKEMTIKIDRNKAQQIDSLSVVDNTSEIITPVFLKESYTYGDINNDNNVNIVDAVNLQKYLLGYSLDSEVSISHGDMNCDELIDVFDMVSIKDCIMKNESKT